MYYLLIYQFAESWRDLLEWFDENEALLDSDRTIGNEPEKIKLQIHKHKEFQRALGTKQPAYDAVNRMGKRLKDKCHKMDVPVLQDMLTQLKNKWNSICGKSVERYAFVKIQERG